MQKTKLTNSDIDPKYRQKITRQEYKPKEVIKDIKIVELKNFASEDGYFLEIARLTDGVLENLPEIKLEQIAFSRVAPGAVKAWHIHYNQEDVWFVPPDSIILAGLHDLRKDSPTKGKSMRLVLGNHKSHLLVIPRGIAHGVVNISNKHATMVYLLNQKFDPQNPDEMRLPWDLFGKDFWEIQKG